MAIRLGPNRYGKAEVRLVRAGGSSGIQDLNVSVALSGDLEATHLTGDNGGVLPTDTMKNTVYAFAREHGIGSPEEFGLRLARHFVATQPQIKSAKITIQGYEWERLGPHSFQRRGDHTRLTVVTVIGDESQVVAGIEGLVLMNTTDSEFHGFPRDRYTTLPETTDRILATEVNARWRGVADFAAVKQSLVDAFVGTYSYSLQQTLYAMGSRVLEEHPEVAEIRLALPNKHHYLVDLSPFGLDNPGEVFIAGDRPYGLIEGTVTRDDTQPAIAEWF
ncbi:factor-independent urate hydroxylase [Actinoplanes sp. NBRC 103695]|uniref:factor-independent urate hydroxylase n=1 Tax=Actinoplanes sp. NBRC 103695 TaxID=3032202 RepID=UPI0024A261D8|nr:urate oxidase [Actinoplanes sp. NBRC 103695]GLY95924.1 uricase [Actinoplanes sp. NBRC 103695]